MYTISELIIYYNSFTLISGAREKKSGTRGRVIFYFVKKTRIYNIKNMKEGGTIA